MSAASLSRPRYLVLPLVLLPLIALALTACGNGDEAAEPARSALVVRPVPASEAYAAYPGEIRARHEPALAFRIGGKIAKRLVEVGDRVKAGQGLAELDPEDVRLQLEAARAQVASAEADLRLAESERARYQALVGRQLISQSQFDTVDNAYKAAQARLKQVRAQFDVARNQAEYAQLTAPADGVIAQRLAEAGQVVAAGQTVFVLAADGEREVVISLPEGAIRGFRLGQPVTVDLWSRPGERLTGRIRELAPAADAAARTFAARVSLDASAAGDVELGQSARVYVANGTKAPLAVPLPAVTADGDQSYVWVVDPETSRLMRRPVRLGAFGETQVPVLEGLKGDDWVVAAGVHLLREGQPVQPVDHDNRPVELALSK